MSPLGLALGFQRELFGAGREAVETGLDLQRVLNRSLVDGIESQRDLQRRLVGLQYVTLRRTIRRTDEETPGPAATEELLRDVDHQVADLQADGERALDALVETLDEGGNTVETVTIDSLDAVEELATLLVAFDTFQESETAPVEIALDGESDEN